MVLVLIFLCSIGRGFTIFLSGESWWFGFYFCLFLEHFLQKYQENFEGSLYPSRLRLQVSTKLLCWPQFWPCFQVLHCIVFSGLISDLTGCMWWAYDFLPPSKIIQVVCNEHMATHTSRFQRLVFINHLQLYDCTYVYFVCGDFMWKFICYDVGESCRIWVV